MDQPRLKIHNQEVGLRKIENNLFEPKSFNVLKQVVNKRWEFMACEDKPYYSNLLPKEKPEKYHKIESFCFVATKNIKEEAELLLRSLRQFHDQPVYVICDKETRIHLVRQDVSENVTFKVCAKEEDLAKIEKEVFKNHHCIANNIHNPPAILKKMEVMEFALQSHSNTFFLDSDIIVLDNLQEYYTADVVLSPHYYPDDKFHKGFEFGFYNAGYMFCANKGFPKFWRYIYLNDSIFFEQECMNRIPNHYSVQTFGEEHNIGFWRGQDLPDNAKSIHAHVTTGVDRNRSKEIIDSNTKIKDYALVQTKSKPRTASYIRKYYSPDTPQKLAFVHFGKCAGVYVQHYLRTHVIPNIKHFNSWWDFGQNNKRSLERDWTKKELLDIATTNTDTGLAHNHQINWCTETVKAFRDNGWVTFTFLRHPGDIICSLYSWSKSQRSRFEHAGNLRDPLKDEIEKISGQDDPNNVSHDDFFRFMIEDQEAIKLWSIPDYIDDIEYVAEFTEKNFKAFLKKYFFHHYCPQEKRNTSNSKGYEFHYKNGDISEDTHQLFKNNIEVLKFAEYLK